MEYPPYDDTRTCRRLLISLPDLPNQFEQAASLVSLDLGTGGRIRAFLLVIGFLALGASPEWLFRRATAGLSTRLERLPAETVNDRLYAVAARLAMAVGRLVVFALGSIGAFLALDWSPLLREIVEARFSPNSAGRGRRRGVRFGA